MNALFLSVLLFAERRILGVRFPDGVLQKFSLLAIVTLRGLQGLCLGSHDRIDRGRRQGDILRQGLIESVLVRQFGVDAKNVEMFLCVFRGKGLIVA